MIAHDDRFFSRYAFSRGIGIKSGMDAERGLLGVPSIPKDRRVDRHASLNDAIADVKKYPQPDTKSQVIKDLQTKIATLCNLHPHQVRFYTAVGTPLDTKYGVDACFEANGKIATIDVSLADKETVRADCLLKVTEVRGGSGFVVDGPDMQSAAQVLAGKLMRKEAKKAA